MTERFRLFATPELFSEGEYKGKLKGVTFTAVSVSGLSGAIEWFTRNRGQFEKSFSKIMHSNVAHQLHASLTDGEQIEFPGVYEEYQFSRGFMFEWSPIYFVAPHTYAYNR